MGKLILVRHGQTELNYNKVFFGKLDPSLNELGIEQANMAKKKLLNISYDNIYSSPLKRAKETAEICNHLKKDIIFDKNIEELNFGIFEGLTYEEILAKYPEEAKLMEKDWKNFNYKTGESPFQMYERVISFLKRLDFSKDNLVVAHWGIINSILAYLIAGNMDVYWKFDIKNGSVVVLEGNLDFCYLTRLD